MPTSVTTLNLLSRPLYMLPQLVAAASAFQSWVGAASSAEALERIHWPWSDDTTAEDVNGGRVFTVAPRPRCIITPENGYSLERESVGGWNTNGELLMAFEKAFEPADYGNRTDGLQRFLIDVGEILDDMKDLAATGEPVTGESHLNVTSMTLVMMDWAEGDDADIEPFFYAMFRVGWLG